MTFNNTDFSNGISLVSSSRFTLSQGGAYNLEFSAQLDKTNSSNSTAYIWLRKNGTDVADTNTGVTLAGGSNDKAVAAWNFYISGSAGDYYELTWTATNDNTYLQAQNAVPGYYPAIPSIIATMGSVDKAGPQGPAGTSGSTFPYTGSAQITGSLTVTGSTTSTIFSGLYTTPQIYTETITIPTATNAMLIGPTISISGSITVSSGSTLTISL